MATEQGGFGRDLMGRGARRWLKHLWAYVRRGQPGGLEFHRLFRRRLAAHWETLERETWGPLLTRANELEAWRWGRGMIDWRAGFLAHVAESVYWWAEDIERRPDRSVAQRKAIEELRRLDTEIVEWAGNMAAAMERRRAIRDELSITSDWHGPGLDLWDLLDSVSRQPSFVGTCRDPSAHLDDLLRYMRETSRETPELDDLLWLVNLGRHGDPYAAFSDDAEAIRKSQGSLPGSWPERVRSLLATLSDHPSTWRGPGGGVVCALDCFSPTMLETLASAAAGFDPYDGQPASLKADALDKAMQRFRAKTRPR